MTPSVIPWLNLQRVVGYHGVILHLNFYLVCARVAAETDALIDIGNHLVALKLVHALILSFVFDSLDVFIYRIFVSGYQLFVLNLKSRANSISILLSLTLLNF